MTLVNEGESQALHDLFWEDELTEAMWWLSAERHVDQVDVPALEQILWGGATIGDRDVERLVEDGLVRPVTAGTYALTERGRTRGAALLGADSRESVAPEACCGSANEGSASCCSPGSAEGDSGCCSGPVAGSGIV